MARKRKTRKYHLSAKYRDYFTANLSLLLAAAVPIQEALESLKDTSASSLFTKAITQIQADIDDGMPISVAMERSGISNVQTLTLVRLGEESGFLIKNLKIAAEQEEKQRMFKSKVRSAMLYPSFVLAVTAVVGIAVAWFLLPQLAQTFSQLDVELPAISLIFINFGLFLKANGIWAVPLFLALTTFLIYLVFFAPKFKIIGQTLLFHIPGISRLLHEIELARFCYLLGTLLQAGLSITQALDSVYGTTQARRYKKLIRYLSESFDKGYSFHETLRLKNREVRVLPPPVRQMIIAGERSGSLPESLISVGKIYESRSEISTQNLEATIEPILLIFVWVGVMGVAIAVILPIYSLVGGLET